eukprot:2285726-Pyramimonas_sp.AAC.2
MAACEGSRQLTVAMKATPAATHASLLSAPACAAPHPSTVSLPTGSRLHTYGGHGGCTWHLQGSADTMYPARKPEVKSAKGPQCICTGGTGATTVQESRVAESMSAGSLHVVS